MASEIGYMKKPQLFYHQCIVNHLQMCSVESFIMYIVTKIFVLWYNGIEIEQILIKKN